MSWTLITTGLLLVAAFSLAGCGGSSVTEGPSATAPSAGSTSPSAGAPASDMVVTRSGGIAGFHDVVQIAADGTAQVTRKTGETRNCSPSPAALDQLRAIDLAAVGTATSKSQMADGFTYEARSASGSASASEGDPDSRRAEFVAAAGAVVSSCLANPTSSGSPEQ